MGEVRLVSDSGEMAGTSVLTKKDATNMREPANQFTGDDPLTEMKLRGRRWKRS